LAWPGGKKVGGNHVFLFDFVLNFPPPSSAFSDFSFVERKERGKKRSEKKLGGNEKKFKADWLGGVASASIGAHTRNPEQMRKSPDPHLSLSSFF
jgi:hypothetical protein